jgi:peptide/nickel transport system permease protein
MLNYILRRLLLMIPTLIGITFMVFMLIAASPGGIGAGLRQAGGQMEATSRAVQEAYLEDRYGLDDAYLVQYVRWLGRVSPIKFGPRDQLTPGGERVMLPKALPDLPLEAWFEAAPPEAGPEPGPFVWPAGITADEERQRLFRRASNQYAQDRAAMIAAKARLELAIGRYAADVGLARAVDKDGNIREPVLLKAGPIKTSVEWPAVEEAGRAMLAARDAAAASRQTKIAMFRARPFPEAGVPVIPGRLWLGSPDLGVAFSRSRPVGQLIAEALPTTLLLNFIAFPIIYAIAIPGGMLAAVYRGKWPDVAMGALMVALWSLPIPLAGLLAVGFLANNDYLGAFPVSGLHDSGSEAFAMLPSWAEGRFERGYILDTLWHLCLPVICLVYGGFAVLSKQTRAAMLENFNADYVRTAKAKGVAPRDVVFAHVFRNSLLPLITMFVTIFPAMLAGAVVIESIFGINGMGKLALDAINLRDRELLLATTLMTAAVNLLALLLADVLYALADPRVTYA